MSLSSMPAPLRRTRLLAWAAVAILLVASAGLVVSRFLVPATQPDLSTAIGGPFTLVDQDGRTVTQANFLGKPTAYFFGFSHCPDACPTTLMDMTDRLKALGPDGDRINVVLVSVDPARDTPKVLKDYLRAFDPRITALTGTQAQVDSVTKAFRVYVRKVGEGADYDLDHSTATYLMDAHGGFTGLIDYQEPQASALAKMRRLLSGQAGGA